MNQRDKERHLNIQKKVLSFLLLDEDHILTNVLVLLDYLKKSFVVLIDDSNELVDEKSWK
jgi:hypothetical protein